MKQNKTIHHIARFFVLLSLFCQAAYAEPAELALENYGHLVTVEQVISRIIKDDARVKEAIARLDKEKSLYKESKAEFYPRLGTEIFVAGASGRKHAVSYFESTLEQPVFDGGKTIYSKKKHKVRVEAEELNLDQQKRGLVLEVKIIYARTLREKELLRISQNAVKEISQTYQWFKKLYEKEIITPYEMFRIKSLLAKNMEATVRHKEAYDYLISVLKEIMGINEESLYLEALNNLPKVKNSISHYVAAFRKTNPLYELTRLAIKEKQFEKKILQADRYPHLGLGVKWDVSHDVFVNNNRIMAGIIGHWDIWDFGRLGAKITAKSHEIDEIKWAGEARIQKEERSIHRLFHEARAMKEKLRMLDTQIREKKEYYKNEKARLVSGQRAETEMLEAYLMLNQARATKIEAITRYRILISRLESCSRFREGRNE